MQIKNVNLGQEGKPKSLDILPQRIYLAEKKTKTVKALIFTNGGKEYTIVYENGYISWADRKDWCLSNFNILEDVTDRVKINLVKK